MADKEERVQTLLAGLVNAGVDWTELAVEGTGTVDNKTVTVSIKVEEKDV